MYFRNNCIKFTHFLSVSQLNLWRNIASNIASQNRAKKSRYSNRAVTYNIAVNVLLKYLHLYACFMLASSYIVVGDSINIFLCATVVEQPQATFAAMDSHCQEHSHSAAIFCFRSLRIHFDIRKWLLNQQSTPYPQLRHSIKMAQIVGPGVLCTGTIERGGV